MSSQNSAFGMNNPIMQNESLLVNDSMVMEKIGGQRQIKTKHGENGMTFFAIVTLLFVLLTLFYPTPEFDIGFLFLVILISYVCLGNRIGYHSQRLCLIKNPYDDSVTIHTRAIFAKATRVFDKKDNVRLKLFKYRYSDDIDRDRVAVAILSDPNRMTFLAYVVPSGFFNPSGRYSETANSCRVRLSSEDARRAAEFLDIPMEEEMGTFNYMGEPKTFESNQRIREADV